MAYCHLNIDFTTVNFNLGPTRLTGSRSWLVSGGNDKYISLSCHQTLIHFEEIECHLFHRVKNTG